MPDLKSAAPVLASLDIERTVCFYCSRLGFSRIYVEPGVWGIVSRDAIQIPFWACSERHIAENTSCRVYVAGIDQLFGELESQGVVHPNAPLENKPWGSREFGVLDPDGNLITFAERGNAKFVAQPGRPPAGIQSVGGRRLACFFTRRLHEMQAFITATLLLLASRALACDCGNLPLPERLDLSTSVFIGEIVEQAPLSSVKLRVVERFKGEASGIVSIVNRQSDCDYFLPPTGARLGDRFLIFLTKSTSGNTVVSRCLGSAPVASASGKIKLLRERLAR